MNLKKYFQGFPKVERKQLMLSLAEAHGRPVSTVYKWQSRENHPATYEVMAITEAWSGFTVSRFDERPDVFNLDSLITALENSGFKVEQRK